MLEYVGKTFRICCKKKNNKNKTHGKHFFKFVTNLKKNLASLIKKNVEKWYKIRRKNCITNF